MDEIENKLVNMRKIYRLTEISSYLILLIVPNFMINFLYRAVFSWQSTFAIAIRASIVRKMMNITGKNVSISSHVIIKNPQNISVGNDVTINEYSFISGAGKLEIGDNVLIGHGVSIITSSHVFKDNTIPIRIQGITKSKVIIEDNCWIGAKATILPGVVIAKGTIVGAGAVVTKNTLPYSIVTGIPAKMIIDRNILEVI